MGLILVQTPCWTIEGPPYTLALLKAVCEKEGYETVCLDFNIKFYGYLKNRGEEYLYDNPASWYNQDYVKRIIKSHTEFIDECVQNILKFSYRVIGFTISGLNRFFAEEIAGRIKDKDKQRIIIFGGPQCFKTEIGVMILRSNAFLDALCLLEGEKVLPRFLKMTEGKNKVDYLKGIAFRNERDEIIDCSEEKLLENLDTLPFADYSDFELEKYPFRQLPVSTSRGCVNRCTFCSEAVGWKKYRFRSAENVFEEMKFQTLKHPYIDHFFFNDSLINGNIKELDKLCDFLIKHKMNNVLSRVYDLFFKIVFNLNHKLGRFFKLLPESKLRYRRRIFDFFLRDKRVGNFFKKLNAFLEVLMKKKTGSCSWKWGGQAAIREEMSKDFIFKMKKAGFSHVSYGLESASFKLLKMMGKEYTPELAERVIRDTYRAGVKVYVTLITGFPGENHEDIMLTARFLKRNRKFIHKILFHPLVISRGSYLYEHRKAQFGIELEDNFNSVSWHSLRENNTLAKRKAVMEFYRQYIGPEAKNFYVDTDYYLFMAERCFSRNDYKKAFSYYLKARELNKDSLKGSLIEEKINLLQREYAAK